MRTGDVEADMLKRIVELRPQAFRAEGKRNIWTACEQPPDGETPDEATFVEFVGDVASITNTGQLREMSFHVLHRFSRSPGPKERALARARMVDLYDAIHLSGGFRGAASKGTYTDVRALSSPVFAEARYFSLNLVAWRDDEA